MKEIVLERLTEQERYILTNLLILPSKWFVMAKLQEWLKLESDQLIIELIEKGVLQRNGVRVMLSPEQGELMKQHLQKDEQKKCLDLINSLVLNSNSLLSKII